MTYTIILWASIIWLAPLICFVLRNEAKFKKNIAVGVTIPLHGRTDEDVIKCLHKFKQEEIYTCIILLLLVVPCLFFKNFSTTMMLWTTWMITCIIIPNIPYIKANRQLKKIKINKGWNYLSKETKEIYRRLEKML